MSPSKKSTKKAAPKKKASAKTTAKKAAAPKKAASKSASKSPKKKAAALKKNKATAAKASGKEIAKKAAPKKAAPKKAAPKASETAAAKSANKAKTAAKTTAKTVAKKPSAPAKQAGSKKGTKAKGSGGKSPAKKGRAKKPILPMGPRHPKLGFRWICFNCDAKFYDLGKEEPICPKCEANQLDRPPKEAKPASNTPKTKVVRPMVQLLDEEDTAPAANADDEDGRRAPRKATGDGEMFDAAETDDASLDIEEPETDSAAEPPDIDI